MENLGSTGVLKPGDRLLDLGCGPGLYDVRFARQGLHVTGVEISSCSLNYAIEEARKSELTTFSNEDRDSLLRHIHAALKPGGLLIIYASTRVHRMKNRTVNHWYIADGGLWRSCRHLVLEKGFDYPEHYVSCSQYIVLDNDGFEIYRFCYHGYNLDTLGEVLEANGFRVEYVWNDLDGTPYSPGGEWLAVVVVRQGG